MNGFDSGDLVMLAGKCNSPTENMRMGPVIFFHGPLVGAAGDFYVLNENGFSAHVSFWWDVKIISKFSDCEDP